MKTTTKAIIPQQTIIFADTELHPIPDQSLDFLLTNKEVASGYGVDLTTINTHKREHADELIEGKHWMRRTVQTNGGKQKVICWSKRGIIRLGFFIRSERAKKFRDFIEDLTLGYFEGCKADQVMTPRIMAYKSNLVQRKKQIEQLKIELNKCQEERERFVKGELHIRRMIEHNFLDLAGSLSVQSKELEAFAHTLECIAKELSNRVRITQQFLDNIVQYFPKAKNVAKIARK